MRLDIDPEGVECNYTAIPNCIESIASGSDRCVYLSLCIHSTLDGDTTRASLSEVVSWTGFSISTVRRSLKSLVDIGAVSLVERESYGSTWRLNNISDLVREAVRRAER